MMADDNDDEGGYAPIDWLADAENEPTRQIEKKAFRPPATRRPGTRAVHAGRPQPPHCRIALAGRRRRLTLHDPGGGIRRRRNGFARLKPKALQKIKRALVVA